MANDKIPPVVTRFIYSLLPSQSPGVLSFLGFGDLVTIYIYIYICIYVYISFDIMKQTISPTVTDLILLYIYR